MNSLPMYFPPAFDMDVAKLCGRLSASAYDQYSQWVKQGKPRKESGFTWTAPIDTGLSFSTPIWSAEEWWGLFDQSEPFGFVARGADGKGYLVFRGTSSASDWVTDADIDQAPYDLVPDYGNVHDGFMKLYRDMRADTLRAFDEVDAISQLWVTGHSLGCGLSTLAVPDVMTQRKFDRVEHYNFASPRVGGPAFTDRYNNNGVLTFRVVNTCDLVPEAPTAVLGKCLYKHIATVVNYSAQYGSLADNHSLTGSYEYALNNPSDPEAATRAAGV